MCCLVAFGHLSPRPQWSIFAKFVNGDGLDLMLHRDEEYLAILNAPPRLKSGALHGVASDFTDFNRHCCRSRHWELWLP